jgi:hypothetical protein
MSSALNRHQVSIAASPRQLMQRHSTVHHGNFIAAMPSRTHDAVFVNLLWEQIMRNYRESHAPEEFRHARKQEHALDLVEFRFGHQPLNQRAPRMSSVVLHIDGNRPHLSQAKSVEVESSTAHNSASIFHYNEVSHVLEDVLLRTR